MIDYFSPSTSDKSDYCCDEKNHFTNIQIICSAWSLLVISARNTVVHLLSGTELFSNYSTAAHSDVQMQNTFLAMPLLYLSAGRTTIPQIGLIN